MTRLGDAVKAIGVLLVAGMLLVGVPVLLTRLVGAPWPDRLPTLTEIEDALTRTGDGFTVAVVYVLAWIVWLAWAQLVVALAVETRAAIAGRQARHLPVIAPGVQGLACRLVTSAVVLATVLSSPAAADPTAIDRLPSPVTAEVNLDSVVDVATAPIAPPSTSPPPDWDLILATLDDGDTSQVNATGAVATATPRSEVSVVEGDNLWDLAEAELEDAWARPVTDDEVIGYWVDVLDSVDDDLEAPHDPDLIYPEQQLTFPAPPQDPTTADLPDPGLPLKVPEDPATPEEPGADVETGEGGSETAPTPSSPPVSRTAPPGAATGPPAVSAPTSSDSGPSGVTPFGVAGAGLAGAVAWWLRRRRRAAMMLRRVGARPSPVSDTEVRDAAQVDLAGNVSAVEDTNDAVTKFLRHSGGARPLLAQRGDLGVELVLDAPLSEPLGEPWQPTSSPTLVSATHQDLAGCRAGDDRLGTLLGLGEDIYLVLDTARVLSINGDPERVAALVRSIVTDIRLGQDEGLVDLRCGIDLATDKLAGLPSEDLDIVVNAAKSWGKSVADNLIHAAEMDGGHLGDMISLRRANNDSAGPTMTVLTDRPIDQTVLELATAGAGVAVLAAGFSADAGYHITIDDDGTAVLVELDLQFRAQGLEAHEAQVVDRLIGAAEIDAEVLAPGESPTSEPPLADHPTTGNDGDVEEAVKEAPVDVMPWESPTEPTESDLDLDTSNNDPDLTINVLGEITIEGLETRPRPQQLAVIAYLALRPKMRATREQIVEAIWGELPPSSRRQSNLISEVRSLLGAERLVQVHGHYQLVGATTDLHQLAAALSDAERLSPTAAAAQLAPLVALIRGQPITVADEGHYGWAALSSIANHAECVAVDAAVYLADLAQESLGDLDLAERAARQGLLASPQAEILVERLVKILVTKGQTTAAEGAIADFERTCDELRVVPERDLRAALSRSETLK